MEGIMETAYLSMTKTERNSRVYLDLLLMEMLHQQTSCEKQLLIRLV